MFEAGEILLFAISARQEMNWSQFRELFDQTYFQPGPAATSGSSPIHRDQRESQEDLRCAACAGFASSAWFAKGSPVRYENERIS